MYMDLQELGKQILLRCAGFSFAPFSLLYFEVMFQDKKNYYPFLSDILLGLGVCTFSVTEQS